MNSTSANRLAISVPEAAGMLSISKRTLERLIARGEFPAPLKIGRASRIELNDVSAYMQRLRNQRREQGGIQ